MRKNRPEPFVSKQFRKLSAGKCQICPCEEYELLDVHRIKAGEKYSHANTVVLCTACHRKHHGGLIKIVGWFDSTAGRMLNWFDETGKEHFS